MDRPLESSRPPVSGHALRDPEDLAQLAARGIPPAEAERQLEVLARPAAWAALERPCTVGDGIERPSDPEFEGALAAHARAAAAGRVSAFVPASGAATRMCRDLLVARERCRGLAPDAARADPSPAMHVLERFVRELPRFAFADALREVLAARGQSLDALRERGPWEALLAAFLDPDGLDAACRPKGLLPFHREAGEVHTAFEEHLVEAVALTGDADGVRRLHVTVSPEHRAGFERLLAERLPVLASRHPGSWQVAFSEQHPATDTVAGDPAGGPFRDEQGRLVFRPAGHGALLRNLAETNGDLVFIRNIDNVAVSRLRVEADRWSRALVGIAATLAEGVWHWSARIDDEGWDDTWVMSKARLFAEQELGLPRSSDMSGLDFEAWLDRPVRVCGVVRNTGEPGGGPFWTRGPDGVTRQIVESAQVDPASPGQAEVFRSATHFNPVFLVACLRDWRGRAHDLSRFVDESAAIVTRKSHGGRELLALERPGLWNGSMARWHTVFVEVPLAVFNPVKTVFDLLRPEHQAD